MTHDPIHGRATRAEAEALMQGFVPRMGAAYARRRGYDKGPGAHEHVSTLSPYLRRRLLTERDLVEAALRAHGPEGAEKFVQEVFWRGYLKGWLEHRPSTWDSYRDGLAADLAALEGDAGRREAVSRAEAGRTGIAGFDDWARELAGTGYLHNHARLWFASIWIFTLRLPWRIGADLFYRQLLDGDPASNTLNWRWVAGLHTRGKPYRAEAGNIATFTEGRFAPRAQDLAIEVEGLQGEEPEGPPAMVPLRVPQAPERGVPTALLITEEDARPEDFDLAGLDIRAVATLSASHLRSPRRVAPHVAAFEAGALEDAARRVGAAAEALRAGAPERLAEWAGAAGARQIATAYVPTGPLRDWLRRAEPSLAERGIALREWRRDWDAAVWPHATAGYFKLKSKIPRILQELDLA